MSANSLFRDLTGERDPIWSDRRGTPLVGSGSDTLVPEWRVFVQDKCSLTHMVVASATAGADSGASTRLTKIRIWACPSGGVLSGFISKGYMQVTNLTAATLQTLRLHNVGVMTFSAGSVVCGAVVTGTVARLGVKFGYCFTKGHVAA